MKDRVLEKVSGYQRSFSSFTAGQKVVAILGTGALLLAGVMVFRWVSQPDYAPLFSKLSSEDASAVIEQLDSQGVKYKITNGGDTVMVPRNDVYKTRIQLSGEGLPERQRRRLLAPRRAGPLHLAVQGADRLQAGHGG